MKTIENLISAIANVGLSHGLPPPAQLIKPFNHFFVNGTLDHERLEHREGCCTRRELLTRMLLLNAVLDQGPDLEGVRVMMVEAVNSMYDNEIRIFHTPLDFFKEINVSVNAIWNMHEKVKSHRADK